MVELITDPDQCRANEAALQLLDLVQTGDSLDAKQFPPMRWALPGVIPEGMGLFTGAPKVGKSWASLDIALAVAAGGHALGNIATGGPRPVLLLALEDGERRLQGRCRSLLGDGQPIPERLHYITTARPEDILPLIDAWLDQYGHQDPLIVLDTLGKVMPPAMPGEGAYSRDYRIGGALKQRADDYPGTALLVVHHVRKMASEDWMNSTSGTNGLNGAADFTINLHRERNSEAGTLRVTGRDVPEAEYAVTVAEGRWKLDGDTLEAAAQAAQQERVTAGLGDSSADVVRLVGQHPDGIGPTAVGLALGMEANQAGVYLRRLADAGRIDHTGRGKYAPQPTVETVETVESAGQDGNTVSTQHLLTVEREGAGHSANSTVSTLSTPTSRDGGQ